MHAMPFDPVPRELRRMRVPATGAPQQWRRSSFCQGADATCVEVSVAAHAGTGDGTVLVRDSKVTDGPVLQFTAAEWEAFLAGVARGEFALSTPPTAASTVTGAKQGAARRAAS